MSSRNPDRTPKTDAEWVRSTENRLRALESRRTQRVGEWVLSAVSGSLLATRPGDVLEVGQEPEPISVDLSQRGSQVTEEDIAGAVTGGNGKTFNSITDWLTAKWSELTTTTTNANTGVGNWTSWLSGGSWANVGAAVSDFLSTKSTAATAGTNATTGLGNWTSWLSGGSWANIAASVSDFLGTKSTANTAGTNASTAMADASAAKTTVQGTIDAGINAIRNTPGAVGQSPGVWEAALASLPTTFFNRFGGNNVSRASLAQANAAMASLVSTINAQGAAINALQNMLEGANGFSGSVSFRQPETTTFDAPGPFTYTLPSWFVLGVDTLDVIIAPAGGGGDGTGVGAEEGGDAGPTSVTVNGTVRTAVGGLGGVYQLYSGQGLDPLTYLDILYPGGAAQTGAGGAGNPPGGAGAAGNVTPINDRLGGTSGSWNAFSVVPTSAVINGTVSDGGAAGAAGFFGFSGGKGAPGVVHIRARAAMPAAFTSMGTLLLPTFKLNTGVAQTDAMTVASSWSRVPPGGSAGGYILIIRANADFTSYVYLWVKTVGGSTKYELGRVFAGAKLAWKTGTISEAVPFNAFSLTSDNGYTFTLGINGVAFDSYTDGVSSSAMGPNYRSSGWASSDAALPGSIAQFAFLDTGTPARIVSNTVAASQGTSSTAAYVDLATTGPSATLNVPASGEVTVDISADYSAGGAAAQTGFMGVALSGANTVAASDARCARMTSLGAVGVGATISNRFHFTGLNPGTTTFKAMFKTSTSTATFSNRTIIVDPKP